MISVLRSFYQTLNFIYLINANFRVGHHSTSDDSSAYRSVEEIEKWTKDESPIQKLKIYIEQKGMQRKLHKHGCKNSIFSLINYTFALGLWDEEADKAWIKETRNTVVKIMQEAEKKKKPHWKEMLEEVYYETTPKLQ